MTFCKTYKQILTLVGVDIFKYVIIIYFRRIIFYSLICRIEIIDDEKYD